MNNLLLGASLMYLFSGLVFTLSIAIYDKKPFDWLQLSYLAVALFVAIPFWPVCSFVIQKHSLSIWRKLDRKKSEIRELKDEKEGLEHYKTIVDSLDFDSELVEFKIREGDTVAMEMKSHD